MITIEQAEWAAANCCGANMPNLRTLTGDNVIEVRKEFLQNVAFNGKRSHEDIILVLQYMSPFCKEFIQAPQEIHEQFN